MRSALICTAQAPLVTGGAELLVRELAANLARRGYRVDVVALPFHSDPPAELLRQSLAWRLLELREATGRPIDLVIATKFPSYLVRHPHKVVWLVHQHRDAYDLFGSPYCSFSDTEEDRRVQESVQVMDNSALGEARALFAISRNVAQRLSRYNSLAATPLYPPPHEIGHYRCDAYGDYLFYAGRLERLKRVDLAIAALARTRGTLRLKIAGSGPLEQDLRRQAERLGVQDRVDFLGFVAAEELVALYAACRAVIYTPVDEDYGYVTVEGFLSHKPVLTSHDAGGPLEFVTDGEGGLVCDPVAEALADAMDRLAGMPESRLREMGDAGRERVADISWDRVVERLTETLR